MTCVYCGGKTRVIDSRSGEDSTRRRRECEQCKHRFSTVEVDADYYEMFDTKSIQKELKKICAVLLDAHEITNKVYNALGME